MKPIILGMGPSGIESLRHHAWHPLAPSTRNLAMIVFGDWLGLPGLEAHFELLNLNEHYHAVVDASGKSRDAVHPDMAARTVSRLLGERRLPPGRIVICLGDEVHEAFVRAIRGKAEPTILKVYHPSNLTAVNRKLRIGWESTMRGQIRATVRLPALAPTPRRAAPKLGWADYGETIRRRYAARYSYTFTDQEWREIWGITGRSDVDDRLQIAEAVVGGYTDVTDEEEDVIEDQYDETRDSGWLQPD